METRCKQRSPADQKPYSHPQPIPVGPSRGSLRLGPPWSCLNSSFGEKVNNTAVINVLIFYFYVLLLPPGN